MPLILLVCLLLLLLLLLPLLPLPLLLLLLLLYIEVDLKLGQVLKRNRFADYFVLFPSTRYLRYLGTERVEWESLGAWIKTHGLIGP